jgi:hypothetical protein
MPSRDVLDERDLWALAERCARLHGISVEAMLSRTRCPPAPLARAAFYRGLQGLGWSGASIARFVGRDNSTIRQALGGERYRVAT